MPPSAIDVISPAFQHAKEQLFRPFRLGQWTRLAVVGLLAGELGTGGFNSGFQIPYPPNRSNSQFAFMQGLFNGNRLLLAIAITLAVVLTVAIWFLLLYLNSRMRFVLFDSIVAKECHIRRFWGQRNQQGFRFFVWQVLFSAAMLLGIALFVGIPLGFAFAMGWLGAPRQHLLPLILGGVFFFFLILLLVVFALLVMVLTKDFVVPQMALENITAAEGWRRLWSMMKEEKGGYAAYIGMKIVLSLVAGVLVAIVVITTILVLLIPVGGIGAIAILAGNAAGLSWNIVTIAIAVAVGIVVLAAILYLAALISVPSIVFFSAYSLHFFAARYGPLWALLHPPAPEPAGPSI